MGQKWCVRFEQDLRFKSRSNLNKYSTLASKGSCFFSIWLEIISYENHVMSLVMSGTLFFDCVLTFCGKNIFMRQVLLIVIRWYESLLSAIYKQNLSHIWKQLKLYNLLIVKIYACSPLFSTSSYFRFECKYSNFYVITISVFKNLHQIQLNPFNLVSSKRLHSSKLQVCLSMCDLFVTTKH